MSLLKVATIRHQKTTFETYSAAVGVVVAVAVVVVAAVVVSDSQTSCIPMSILCSLILVCM